MDNQMNNKPIIILNGLEGNPPVTLNATQKVLAPYTYEIIALWWIIWGAILCIMVIKKIILPAWRQKD